MENFLISIVVLILTTFFLIAIGAPVAVAIQISAIAGIPACIIGMLCDASF